MIHLCLTEDVLPEKEKALDKLELSLSHSRGDGSDFRAGVWLFPLLSLGSFDPLKNPGQPPGHCPQALVGAGGWELGLTSP
jgi:hypothetical protein